MADKALSINPTILQKYAGIIDESLVKCSASLKQGIKKPRRKLSESFDQYRYSGSLWCLLLPRCLF